MEKLINAYLGLNILSAVISSLIAVLVWVRRKAVGARYLFWLEVGIVIWSFAYGLEASSHDLMMKIFWSKVSYLGIVSVPLFYFMFVIDYCQVWTGIRWYHRGLILALPAVTLFSVWLHPYVKWIWTDIYIPEESLLAVYENGMLFFIWVIYVYILMVVGSYLLVRSVFRFPRYYQAHIAAIILGAILPFSVNLLYITRYNPFPGLDWTPVMFCVSGVLLAWAITQQGLLKMVPVARDQLIEDMKDGVLVVNYEGQIIDFNSAAQRILDEKEGPILGSNIGDVFSVWSDFIDRDPHFPYTMKLELDEDRVSYFDMDVSPLRAWREYDMGYLVVLREITERRNMEHDLRVTNQILSEKLEEIEQLKNELREQALHDPLTNLCNRRYLEEIMDRELPRAVRGNYTIGLVMIDIDHFKQFNDAYGHRAGDLVLKSLANFLIRITREGDIVCRYGGEEFLILMINIDGSAAYDRAEEFRKRFERLEIRDGTNSLQTTISLGISLFPKHATTAEELIEKADQAMYQAKQLGRNRTVVWQEDLQN